MLKNIDSRTGKAIPPPDVLEALSRIDDSEFNADPQIMALKASLESGRGHWEKARTALDKIISIVDGIPNEIERSRKEISLLQERRPEVLAAAVLGDGSFAADDELMKEQAALELRIDRLMRCQPGVAMRMRAADARVAEAVRPVIALEDAIDERLRDLKLREAERRCA